ncbi:sugar ABC transporter permease [Haloarchaeobius litoreus]|uniref:Sugar ABC transporter permease n=1 Tax=Haloarchaeobius litoreus TaxID=755306 RepID=A0ABD6DGG8_9EURY|nr:ABC transporter permease subunit [Haloarchaeobius litoreus]
MSLLRSVARSVGGDVRTVMTAPKRAFDELRYTVAGLRTGDVRPRDVAWSAVSTVGALLVVSLLLFPIYWVFKLALSGGTGSFFATTGINLLPTDPTFQTFVWVLGDLILPSYRITLAIPGTGSEVFLQTPKLVVLDASAHGVEYPSRFQKYLWNSVTVAVPTVVLAMCMIVPGAYALSRREFIGRGKLLYGYVLFTQVGGGIGIASLIALYALFVQYGLTADKFALAFYYAATAVPFNTWLLKTYMDGIPKSYEEAAYVDGASTLRVVWEVILPLSKAGLATVFIFTFLAGWTEFVVAQTVLTTDQYTLPVGLYLLVSEYSTPWPKFSAFALTFALPIMLVYLLAQRYIEDGLSFGGVEG